MSTLTQRKTRLIFETAGVVRERGKLREVIIEAQPYLCVVRLKGMRKRLLVSWPVIHNVAAKIAAEEARAKRKTQRKERGKG